MLVTIFNVSLGPTDSKSGHEDGIGVGVWYDVTSCTEHVVFSIVKYE